MNSGLDLPKNVRKANFLPKIAAESNFLFSVILKATLIEKRLCFRDPR